MKRNHDPSAPASRLRRAAGAAFRLLRRAGAALLVAGCLLGPAPASLAANGAAGTYVGTVDLGPVLLDGRYPFTVGGRSTGTIDVSTSPTGALDARITFAAQTEDAVGRIKVRKSQITLELRGKVDEGRIQVNAKLRGSAFVGTVTLRGKTQACRIEIGSAALLRASYNLTLKTSKRGAVTGTGTLTAGRKVLAVTVRGKSRKQRIDLTVSGKRTLLKFTRGELSGGNIAARKWNAVGFGAIAAAGRPVRFFPY